MFLRFPFLSSVLIFFIFYFSTLLGTLYGFDIQKSNFLLYMVVILGFNIFNFSKKNIIVLVLVGMISFISSLFFDNNKYIFYLFWVFMLFLLYFIDKKNDDLMGRYIILVALFFNLSFITNTSIRDVQYDFPSCYNYIEYIVENNFMFWNENPLISRPSYSSYHPILHFFIAGIWLKFGFFISSSVDASNEAMQILFLSYLFLFYVISSKILKNLNINGLNYIVLLVFITFFPIFNAIGGYVNNDMLLIVFQAFVILNSILYYKTDKQKYLFYIIIGATLGCLTKLSGILVLGGVGFLFLVKLYQKRNKKTFRDICIASILILVGISIWPIYQYVVLGVDFSFVPPQEHLSLVKYSLFERFNPIKAFTYTKIFYNDFGINLFETMTKTALFGQWDFTYRISPNMWLIYLLVLLYKFILFSIIVFGGFILVKERKNILVLYTFVLLFSVLAGQIAFSLKHPYMCNQDFRYGAVLVLIMAMIFGFVFNKINNKLRIFLCYTIVIFGLTSLFVWWLITI